MIRNSIAASLLALALPAAAQQAVPTANYSDIWGNTSEAGWGVAITQHADNQLVAVWYTYDPRAADASSPGNFKPLWIIMPGGTWTTPTSITGDVYVTVGTPFAQAWNPAAITNTKVGTFTFTFASTGAGTFVYNVAAPAGLASTAAGFGMPSFSGSKQIQRTQF
jgi:hypothetical protein